MAHINRRYIDSHWLIFIIQGTLALLFGWLTLFHATDSISFIVALVGIFLLGLSIIEFTNSLNRARKKTGWIVSVAVALVDVAAALLLLLTLSEGVTWYHLTVIAVYTLLRGVFEIFIGFRTTVDPTDRFIWVLTGICGTIMGFVIFNSGALATNSFVRFFGAYLLIFGVSSLIYGVHNRAQQLEDHRARVEAAKSRRTSKKTSKKK